MNLHLKTFNSYSLLFLLFIPVFLFISCDSNNNNGDPVVLKIDPDDDSCVPLTDQYATCAEACEAEPLNCAADILLHLESEGFISRREINPTIDNQTGAIEDGIVQKPNIQTPMHGLFVPVWNNPQLNDAIENALENPFDTFIAPPWSISAKLNNAVFPENSNPRDLNWATVMYKIPGYCPERIFPDDPDAPCLGGEWFWFLNRGGFLSFDWDSANNSSVPAFGKASDFCLNCHGAVADTDWLWITHDLIRREQQLTGTPTIDGHTPASTGAAFCDDVTSLSPDRPTDVLFDPTDKNFVPDGQFANRMFNCYGWKTFVALFWPSSETQRGVPDKTKSIEDPGQRVWGTYKQTYEVFQPSDPNWTLDDKNWNDDQPLPDVCSDALIANDLPTDSKSYQVLNETHQAYGSQFNNLIDQNNSEVHYNVRLNRDEFERMKEKGYADTGIYDYNGPIGINKTLFQMPDNTDGVTGEGATELKSAWKIMCTDPETCKNVDDPSRYYTETVLIYTPAINKVINPLDPSIIPQNEITQPAACEVAEVGLVGFHIAVKTFWAPQWIWPTFEHIDNVPGNTAEGEPIPETFSFFDPECAEVSLEDCVMQRPGITPPDEAIMPELRCCPNQQIIVNSSPDPANVDSDLVGLFPPKPVPIQVSRLDPVGNNTGEISVREFNELFRGLLAEAGSPLQNYIMVNTQWPINGRTSATTEPPHQIINKLCLGNDQPSTCVEFIPQQLRLRNSAIETYDMAYCEPTDSDIGNEGGPDCTPEGVSDNPMQSGSGGCMNCHFSAGTDSSFIWADGIEEQVPLNN